MRDQPMRIGVEDELIVTPHPGMARDVAVESAHQFCKVFDVKCVLVNHNDRYIQVTRDGERK